MCCDKDVAFQYHVDLCGFVSVIFAEAAFSGREKKGKYLAIIIHICNIQTLQLYVTSLTMYRANCIRFPGMHNDSVEERSIHAQFEGKRNMCEHVTGAYASGSINLVDVRTHRLRIQGRNRAD